MSVTVHSLLTHLLSNRVILRCFRVYKLNNDCCTGKESRLQTMNGVHLASLLIIVVFVTSWIYSTSSTHVLGFFATISRDFILESFISPAHLLIENPEFLYLSICVLILCVLKQWWSMYCDRPQATLLK